jgi:hypothetical protein
MHEPSPDDQPTVEADAAAPAADELREQARQLHEEAADRARAAAELRDAAAALRDEAAVLLERVPEPTPEDGPEHEDPEGFDMPLGTPAAEDAAPRRRWFRRRG